MVDGRDHQALLLPAPAAPGLWQDGVGGQGTGDKTERGGAGCVEEMTGEQVLCISTAQSWCHLVASKIAVTQLR